MSWERSSFHFRPGERQLFFVLPLNGFRSALVARVCGHLLPSFDFLYRKAQHEYFSRKEVFCAVVLIGAAPFPFFFRQPFFCSLPVRLTGRALFSPLREPDHASSSHLYQGVCNDTLSHAPNHGTTRLPHAGLGG